MTWDVNEFYVLEGDMSTASHVTSFSLGVRFGRAVGD